MRITETTQWSPLRSSEEFLTARQPRKPAATYTLHIALEQSGKALSERVISVQAKIRADELIDYLNTRIVSVWSERCANDGMAPGMRRSA
jgi:hypothetical protein